MPRLYIRKPGSRSYINYTEEHLEQCLREVRNKLLTQRAAAAKYGIPRSTIKNKLKNIRCGKPGHPTVFTKSEENSFVAHITALAEYGFPLTDVDLRYVVRDYIASQGRHVPEFKNNTPGREWVTSFLKRHQELSKRFANNIKRVRAQVNEKVIKDFIQNLTPVLESIPPENILNYDETNLSDDPGKKTVICRRGTKYPERIINSTKVSYTVMFCGSAAGETIPPYIIYKSDHLWSTWMEQGPKGSRYNRTKSGWMDSNTFEDWFLCHLLPLLKKKAGRKVIIGDNLSSHINRKVLLECEQNDISFICLPPNATHILQPLDVAYFRPLKNKWRQVLMQWKDSQQGRKLLTTPKEIFPSLLKKALDDLTDTKLNMIAGFRRSGIFPLDKEEPVKRLPRQDRIVNPELITDSFLRTLGQMRNDGEPTKKKNKKKKLDVPPGRSISVKDLEEAGPSSVKASSAGVIKSKAKKTKKGQKPCLTQKSCSSSTTECSDILSLASSTEDLITAYQDVEESEEDLPLSKYSLTNPKVYEDKNNAVDENQQSMMLSAEFHHKSDNNAHELGIDQHLVIKENSSGSNEKILKDKGGIGYIINDFVLVKWNSRIYPGQITSLHEEGAVVNCMKKGKTYWKWPTYKDEQLYSWVFILQKISVPKFVGKGNFTIPEIDNN